MKGGEEIEEAAVAAAPVVQAVGVITQREKVKLS